MMRYDPLRKQFDITAMGTHRPLFDFFGIKLDIRKLHSPSEVFYRLGTIPAQLINREVTENTDIFLPVTHRNREMLLVEGVPE